MTGRRVVVRAPEVLESTEVWARPVEREPRQPEYIVVQAVQSPAVAWEPARDVEPSAPSKTIPWVLIAVSAAILLYTVYAMWHSLHGPDLVRVRSHPVDLVGPHR